MKTFVYGLFDPKTGQLRYVGHTRHLQRRLYQHSTKPHDAIADWVKSLRRRNLKPEIRVLEECEGDGVEREQYWIRKSLAEGHPILNERIMNETLTSSLAVKLPRDVIEDFKAAARGEGKTTSEWLMEAGKEKLAASEFVCSPS